MSSRKRRRTTARPEGATAEPWQPPHALREYALLADGERGILVGPRGEFAWMCFPRWDSDGVFSSLIGGGGAYSISPAERFVWGGYYEPGGLIWRSRWVTDDGAIMESREALVLPARTDRAVVLRRAEARAGRATLRISLDLRGGFGSQRARELARADDGTWTCRVGDVYAAWGPAGEAVVDGGTLSLLAELEEGQRRDFVLVLALERAGAVLPDPGEAWSATETGWQERVPALEQEFAARDARHACAVLSGLTSTGGGMVAAATTSLPERANRGRNYDYRYVWIRDQCYAGEAAARAGVPALLDDAVRFVSERLLEDGPGLKPAYTTAGCEIPGERRLDLRGYPGGTDVVGNHVRKQFQLDAFGEALLLFATAAAQDRLSIDSWRAAEVAAAAIEQRWREPDAGIWELDPDEWTHSRLICAAGLRAMSKAPASGEQAARWLALADTLTADAGEHCVHRSGRWQRSPTDERVDAALLLAPLRGAVPADDPRAVATVAAVIEELTEDGYVYRYRPDERPLGEAEGAFLLCGFLLALARAQQGDLVAAVRWFERSRTACGPPGLLSEEFDVRQRQLRGNLPQAFVHALLLEAACELQRLVAACE